MLAGYTYYVTLKSGWDRPAPEVGTRGDETLLGVCVRSHHSDAPESRFPSFFVFVFASPLLSLSLRVALPASVVLVSSLRDDVVWTTAAAAAESFTRSAVLSLQLVNFARDEERERERCVLERCAWMRFDLAR